MNSKRLLINEKIPKEISKLKFTVRIGDDCEAYQIITTLDTGTTSIVKQFIKDYFLSKDRFKIKFLFFRY